MQLRTLILSASVLLGACAAPASNDSGLDLDADFLTADIWNDGQAEVAFYQIKRSRDQYGREREQSFLAGTYLVKHDFDRATASKATSQAANPVSAFKYALFYEFESRSYEYKRSWVANLAQADLSPIKASFSSFDWCSNQYREFSFDGNGRVDHLYRSDDYGNASESWRVGGGVFPASAIPVLVRAIQRPVSFSVLTHHGSVVAVQATSVQDEAWGDSLRATRIELAYSAPVPSMIGEESALSETWIRGTGPARVILAMRSGDDRYRMDLVEHLRSPYWEEDLYTKLKVVRARP
ncbi:MAG: hypothetical protein ACI80V_000711 [Rhodothermales bacterium]|jgi:hypothetical protein